MQKIKTLIYDQKQVDVATLSKMLNVTEVTIRSDLEQLEKTGFLKRLHGGAILNEGAAGEQEINSLLQGQVVSYNQGKELAAKAAAQLVDENDHIFLGAGETCYYIAKELLGMKHLTVLTNNLYVAYVLSASVNINVIITGGQLNKGLYCAAGDMFKNSTENLYVSKSFFSVSGVNLTAGYTVDSSSKVHIFREMAQRSRQVVIAADHKKFDNISFVKLGGLDTPLTLATDAELQKPYADYFKQHGIEVLVPR